MSIQSKISSRWIWSTAFSLMAYLTVHAFVIDTGQDSRALAQNENQKAKPAPQYIGPNSCGSCHFKPNPNNPFEKSRRDFCAMTEGETIVDHDKHFESYTLLDVSDEKNVLARRMQEILSANRGENYAIQKDLQCLACHADLYGKPGLDRESFAKGVTCESCHGPGSKYKAPHQEPSWRSVSPREKEKEGFIDVRNPIHRSKQCFSCHIGNVKQGKIVTHEMYAAGHPPLPSIEIETFVSQMPTHWRIIHEKGEFAGRAQWVQANMGVKPDLVKEDLLRSKAVIISGVVALRESVNLFVTQSVERQETWPEFAVFDCIACHHDLDAPSWRQRRGYAKAVPGRPIPFAWPTALVKLAIRQRAGEDDKKYNEDLAEFKGYLELVHTAVTKRPFGNKDDLIDLKLNFNAPVNDTPSNLVEWLDKLVDDVYKSQVNKNSAKLVLDELVNLPPEDFPDYHSARQLIWAFRVINAETMVTYPTFEKGTGAEAADRNLKDWKDWRKSDVARAEAAIDKRLDELGFSEKLGIKLPAGRAYVIGELLPTNLELISDYDQDWFRVQLLQLKPLSKIE